MSKKFAVFGNPIKHSLSPQIHQNFAKQHQLDIRYERISSEPDHFTESINQFFDQGGEGCNVTSPFKEQTYELCDQLTASAERAKAVNTLYKTKTGQFEGHNTDGGGLIRDLTINLRMNLQGANIVVLGAGGATRGILQPLIEQAPLSLTIINRTLSKAETLAKDFEDLFNINTIGADNIPANLPAADLILNATSASLNAELPVSDSAMMSKNTIAYDLAYALKPTPFLQWTEQCGCKSNHDGRGMLVEQAALAFTTWTGLKVKTASLIKDFENLNVAQRSVN